MDNNLPLTDYFSIFHLQIALNLALYFMAIGSSAKNCLQLVNFNYFVTFFK